LLKNSQKHLYLIAVQFIDLLRNFVKQAERSRRPSKLNGKKLMDISDYAAESTKITAQVGARERYRA
jgi:hypothetical protein